MLSFRGAMDRFVATLLAMTNKNNRAAELTIRE
jgi:hypothetical protein